MKYIIATEATTLPVSIEEVKTHLRIESYYDHDDLVRSYIEATAKMIEQRANLAIMHQTWKLFLSPEEIKEDIFFFKWPVASISSIKYYDESNTLQTLSTDSYLTALSIRPAQIIITDLPSVYDRSDAMEITFIGGFTTVPADIKLGIKQRVYNEYNRPGDSLETKMTQVERLINDYRSYEK